MLQCLLPRLGICTPSEFRCARGPCIASSLRCDGHDQCGDDSDECPWKSWLVVSLVAATCLGSLLTAVVMCCCCSQYRSRFRRPRTRGRIIPSFAVSLALFIRSYLIRTLSDMSLMV